MASHASPRTGGRETGQQPDARSFGQSMWLTVLSALVPGSGFLAAGRRVLGAVVLAGAAVVLAAVAAAFVYESSPTVLGAELASRPSLLNVLAYAVIGLAVAWVIVIVASHLLLRPRAATGLQRGLGFALVLALCAAVVAPSIVVAQGAWATRSVVEAVFPSDPVTGGDDDSAPEIHRDDPWRGTPRLNVLLLGADSGPDREGLRTDTMIVASIDTSSGDTALFSLPRNLQDAPFPRDNPLHDIWPDGYKGGSGSATLLLNGVYREAAENYPNLFPGDPDPGMTTLRGVIGEITGLEIDYYLMVNLAGFESFVDALGGIDIDVGPNRIPIGGLDVYGNPQPDSRIEEWIEPGFQHLNGYQALWFSRDRRDSDDYDRMRRQRCVINAIVSEVSPTTVLANYVELAATAEDNITTDVPRALLPALVELGNRVRATPVRTLTFTDEIISTVNPDFRLIRKLVADSLQPPAPTPAPTPSAAPTTGTPTPAATTTTPAPDATVAVPAAQVCG